MPWSRLNPLLANINLASGMNLNLWLASCYGGYFVTAYPYWKPVPFAFIVGPANEIGEGVLLAFTCTFYTELFRMGDMTEALNVARVVRPDITYIAYSAVSVFRTVLTARGKNPAPKIVGMEEPLFDQYRRKFFALNKFPDNAERFAITYAKVLAQVEADEAAQK
jgi:hypothetical protein